MSDQRSFSRRFTGFVTRRPRRLIATVLLIGAAALAVGLPVVHILVPTRTDFDDAHAQAGQGEHQLSAAGGGRSSRGPVLVGGGPPDGVEKPPGGPGAAPPPTAGQAGAAP